MECLDLQILRRTCRPDAKAFDVEEMSVINDNLVQLLLSQVDAKKVAVNLYRHGYIDLPIMKNVERYCGSYTDQSVDFQNTKRVLNYLTNKISFVAFLWALASSGYQTDANMLLSLLYKRRTSILPNAMNKFAVFNTKAMYFLVRQLKFVSDSKIFGDPVTFIRHLAIRFRGKFNMASPQSKRRTADAYFGTLAVELDNFSFLRNKYIGIQALTSELRRVLPFTSNPMMNEALVNGRIAEMSAVEGKLTTALNLMHDAISVMVQSDLCIESGNMILLQLNVLLHDYETNPTMNKKKQFIEIGESGLRMLEGLQNEFTLNFRVYIMQRVIYCALDLSISGKPMTPNLSNYSMQISRCFLSELEHHVENFGLRRTMCYKLAMGRLLHLVGQKKESLDYLKEAKVMAKRGNFVEFEHLNEYVRSLSSGGDKYI